MFWPDWLVGFGFEALQDVFANQTRIYAFNQPSRFAPISCDRCEKCKFQFVDQRIQSWVVVVKWFAVSISHSNLCRFLEMAILRQANWSSIIRKVKHTILQPLRTNQLPGAVWIRGSKKGAQSECFGIFSSIFSLSPTQLDTQKVSTPVRKAEESLSCAEWHALNQCGLKPRGGLLRRRLALPCWVCVSIRN